MISLIAFVFVLSILILVHELGHFLVAKRMGVKVERFSLGFGSKILGFKRGETEYWISAIPLGGYVKMAGDNPEDELTGAGWEFLSKPVGKRFGIVLAGPLANYLLAFFIFSALFFTIGGHSDTTTVGELLSDFPAQEAGLEVGDKILSIDGEPVKYWNQMTVIIHKAAESKLEFEVKRGEEIFVIAIKTRLKKTRDVFGKEKSVGLIGIVPPIVKYGFFKSFYIGAKKTAVLTGMVYKSLWMMLRGELSAREITGPIGIFALTSSFAKYGFLPLLNFLAFISVNLAIVNLLPLPVLDGGHILFLACEKIKGRPLSRRFQELATQTGLVILVGLVLFVCYNDFIKYQLWEKAVTWWKR